VHKNLQLHYKIFLQKSGLEETTLQEAPTEDALPAPPQTSPTDIYKKQKDNLQRLPPQPFEQPPILTLGDSPSNELVTQQKANTDDLQASHPTNEKSKSDKLTSVPQPHKANNEIETPTPKLRSRRARPIRVKQFPDMIYY